MKPRPVDKWRSVDLTQERVNRHASRQPYRLLAGLTITSDFSTVQAALVAASGRGHFLTIRHIDFVEHKLPKNLTCEMTRLCGMSHVHLEDMRAIASDYTGQVALAAESLKCRAGRYVDRILAVTFLEPWEADNSLLQFSANVFLPQRLAELTGLNVIDRIPESDRAAGGKGFPLAGYPMWLLLADRHSSVARGPTAAILIDRDCDLYWLPSSDGLDTSPPAIQWRRIHNVWNSANDPPGDSAIQLPFLQEVPQLLAAWQRTDRQPIVQVLVAGPNPIVDAVRCEIVKSMMIQTTESTFDPIIQIDFPNQGARAFSAAILGALLIDQVPSNLPDLTGADGYRLLGQITPGKPARWRELVTTMSDHAPLPLKLRDAI